MVSEEFVDLGQVDGFASEVVEALDLLALRATHRVLSKEELEGLRVLVLKQPHSISITLLLVILQVE